jgi:hypothetical protein
VPPKPPVPPEADVESKERVEHLLEQYVRAHQHDLCADVARYGDVRTAPDFDLKKRLEEMQALRRRELDRERQGEDVEAMNRLMDELEAKFAKSRDGKPGKIGGKRRQLVECYRKYVRRPPEELLLVTRAWLEKADRFQERHAAVFRPAPTEDAPLLARLATLGPYHVDPDGRRLRVSWEEPRGLTCTWTAFSLSLEYPANDPAALRRLLDACDRLRGEFPQHEADLRREVLESFEIYHEQLARWGWEDYEVDAAGNPTEASILANAGSGHLCMETPQESKNEIEIRVFFRVAWDEEHGLELAILLDPE